MNHTISQKGYKGMGMEGAVARWYASQTHKSLDEFKSLARRIAGEIAPESAVLEVAPGPGYFAIELAKLGAYRVTGLDISRTFVDIARRNAGDARVQVDFRHGDASDMPFADNSFDFLLCRAAFKNFSRPVAAIEEMYRVLKPSGRAVIMDLRRDASKASIAQLVQGMRLGAVNAAITKLTFRFLLLKRAYTRKQLEDMVAQTKFRAAKIKEDVIGFEVWLQK